MGMARISRANVFAQVSEGSSSFRVVKGGLGRSAFDVAHAYSDPFPASHVTRSEVFRILLGVNG